jgi:NAD(P)-dependent dehydrogenase (short-subunit alcohol dehydrogenase family)
MEAEREIRGAVVITGCSTGIGYATALHRAQRGHRVFAGVRSAGHAASLEAASPRIAGLPIDVTDAASIEAAAKRVAAELDSAGLAGLVNNAGIALGGPLEFLVLDELRRQLEVNLIGQVAVTQAFLPLIRRGRGRIVFVSSIGGRIAQPIIGPYNASKFALEAAADALRQELRPSGLHVAVIEPGGIKTAIFEKARPYGAEMLDKLPEEGRRLYADMGRAVVDAFSRMEKQAIPPERVARAIEHALTASRPKTRYLVGIDARIQALLAWLLPDRARDWVIARFLGLS